MKLVVGLGNPGKQYAHTRHNIGFQVVTKLAGRQKISLKKGIFSNAATGSCIIDGNKVLMALPATFMNLSGIAVSALLRKHRISPADCLIICDDMDLEFGSMRLRSTGSAGGHNGLKSIIAVIKSQDFCRLRVGVGRPRTDCDAAEYVLSSFSKNEKEKLAETVDKAVDCCVSWITKGIAETMNTYNRKEEECTCTKQ
ncbi:MAG TPA: aminoacyl-tRNA hydrolase [Candidatus Omnitrophota bacterium]|nr:aminoacyl-tRNA hydrolase [Candidatus Omnitrophota bacterium]HPT07211.1 aminoacyl-tRNA hydrolase [Candidatus Omnitrophota bacterium]